MLRNRQSARRIRFVRDCKDCIEQQRKSKINSVDHQGTFPFAPVYSLPEILSRRDKGSGSHRCENLFTPVPSYTSISHYFG